MAAYAREGIHFGRSTTAMLDSGRLVRETQRQARRGDLAFYGTGHVEFFVRPGHTFGALDSGTLIGWHHVERVVAPHDVLPGPGRGLMPAT